MMIISQTKPVVRNCRAHTILSAAMSVTSISFGFVIKHSSSAANPHSQTHSGTSRNWFESRSLATATRGISTRRVEHHKRLLFVRAKEGGSQGGPGREELQLSQNETDDTNAEVNMANQGKGSNSVLSFLCPLLKFVGGGDPSLARNDIFEITTSGLASIARLPWGSQTLPTAAAVREEKRKPCKALQLYEFEACPFCRRVREALTELDLSAEVYPCPKGSLNHREIVRRYGGKEQFPYLIDPNTGVSLYESGDIVKYLFQQYGNGNGPSPGLLESTLFTGWVPTIMRAGRGMTLWEKAKPELAAERLELFSYENSPYARIVREALCELELPYILHNAGKGSSQIKALLQLAGSDKVPYLIDPNTGVCLDNHKEIISYLFQTYCSA